MEGSGQTLPAAPPALQRSLSQNPEARAGGARAAKGVGPVGGDKDSTLGSGGDLPSSTGRRSPRWDLSSLRALCLPSGYLSEVVKYPLLTHSSPRLLEACALLGRVSEAVESAVGTSVCSQWARRPRGPGSSLGLTWGCLI